MSKQIKFLEKNHRYLDDEDRELISVSKFTERFKEKVDWAAIAKRSAAKATRNGDPTTTQQIQKKWADKRDISAAVGTLFHSIKEAELIGIEKPEFYGTVCTKEVCHFDGEAKYSIPINNLKNNTVYPEMMIYDLEHMICGQSDKVIIQGNKIHIWDYKTDKSIDFHAFSSEWVQPRRLTGPLKHLEDCNGNVYSIKMSLYMYMLWKANKGRFKPGDIVIEHIKLQRNDEGIPILDHDLKPVVLGSEQITLPYRKKEVMAMLKTLK